MSLTSFEDDILSCEDPEECTFHLTAVIRVHLDVQAQVKSFQTKKRFCPWVDEVAKLTILRKQKLHAIWKKTGKMEDKKKYRECRVQQFSLLGSQEEKVSLHSGQAAVNFGVKRYVESSKVSGWLVNPECPHFSVN